MRPKIGTQTVGLHPLLAQENVEVVLKELQTIGFDGFEFAWNERYTPVPEAYFKQFFKKTAAELRELFGKYDVEPVSSHVPFVSLQDDFDTVVNFHEEVGCSTLGVADLTEDYFTDQAAVKEAAAAVSAVAERVADRGFDFVYHNHAFEFNPINGKIGYDLFVDSLNDDVGLQVDLRHVLLADRDPVDVLEELDHRIASVHISDLTSDGEYVKLGDGALNVPQVCEIIVKREVPWIIIEEAAHIRGDLNMDALETLRHDYDYLAATLEEVDVDE